MEGYFIDFRKEHDTKQYKLMYAVIDGKAAGSTPIYVTLDQNGVLIKAAERPKGKKLFRIEAVGGELGFLEGHSVYAFHEKDDNVNIEQILIDERSLKRELRLHKQGEIKFTLGERIFSAEYRLSKENINRRTALRKRRQSTIEQMIEFQ